jgi:hypothetical protein
MIADVGVPTLAWRNSLPKMSRGRFRGPFSQIV